MAETYPKREQFFAHKVVRLMTRVCAAQEIGAESAWLVTVIAHQEDAKQYRAAPTFWNPQLIPLVGCKSYSAMNRARKKAIEAGWLHYEPGSKGKVGRYWVTIPEHYLHLAASPVDEDAHVYLSDNEQESGEQGDLAVQKRIDKRNENPFVWRQTEREAEEKRKATGNLSFLLPSPTLEEEDLSLGASKVVFVVEWEEGFQKLRQAYPAGRCVSDDDGRSELRAAVTRQAANASGNSTEAYTQSAIDFIISQAKRFARTAKSRSEITPRLHVWLRDSWFLNSELQWGDWIGPGPSDSEDESEMVRSIVKHLQGKRYGDANRMDFYDNAAEKWASRKPPDKRAADEESPLDDPEESEKQKLRIEAWNEERAKRKSVQKRASEESSPPSQPK